MSEKGADGRHHSKVCKERQEAWRVKKAEEGSGRRTSQLIQFKDWQGGGTPGCPACRYGSYGSRHTEECKEKREEFRRVKAEQMKEVSKEVQIRGTKRSREKEFQNKEEGS